MFDEDAIRVLIQAAGYGTDTASVAAQNQAISAAFMELQAERKWSWLRARSSAITLTAGSETVSLASVTDLAVPLAAYLKDGSSAAYDLEKVDPDTLQRNLDLDLPVARNRPTQWAWVRNTVLVYPRPDKAYTVTLDYVKGVAETSFDATDEALPTGFDPRFAVIIAWGAIRWLARRQRDEPTYQAASSEWARAKQQFEQEDQPPGQDQVRDWSGWNVVRPVEY